LILFAAVACWLIPASAQAQAPLVNTQSAGPVRATNAILNGMVVARGSPTVAWFEWGTNRNYGFTTVPQDIGSGSHIVRVSAPLADLVEEGVYHFRIVASNSVGTIAGFDSMFTTGMRVQHWGSFTLGSPSIPPGLTNLSGLASGHRHCIGIHNDGSVSAWLVGRDSFSNNGQTNVPSGLSLADVVAISCGTAHTLALKADGTIAVWGGDGGASQPPASATNVVAVATMGVWNLALRADGTVVDWGQPLYPDVPKPPDVTNVQAIVSGYGYSEVLKADGTLEGWGRADDATNIPPTLSNVVAFASGDYHRLGLAPVNLPPKCLGRTVPGPINSALPVSLAPGLFDPNGDPLSVRIASLPVHGSLYQYTTNGLGTPISAPNTVVADASHVFFMPEQDGYGAPYDIFSIVANDGQLDSAPATWSIWIVPPPVVQVALTTNGPTTGLVLSFIGLTNVSYVVLGSVNLSSWSYLDRATPNASNLFSYTNSISSPFQFYRVRML
jgi:hypothetical protein